MRPLVLLALALSGCAALALEIAWTRWLGLHLGNFMTATSTVAAVYMLGLGVGSVLSGRLAGRLSPGAALRGYAIAEAVIAGCALLSPFVLGPGAAPVASLSRVVESPVLRALLCGLVLLPPTIAMGATLPLLVRALGSSDRGLVGRLYAVNTLGAAAGPVLAVHALSPGVGWTASVHGAGLLGLAAAGLGWMASVRAVRPDVAADPVDDGALVEGEPGLPGWLAFGSGFVALLLQICFTRLLILTVTGSSVYGLATILSSTLLGIAMGGVWFAVRPPADPAACLRQFGLAQLVVWLAALFTAFADRMPGALAPVWAGERSFAFRASLDYAVAFGLAGPAAVASGYALPSLVGASGSRSAGAVGRLFALNTLGAVLGAWLAGWVLLPFMGLHGSCMTAALLAGVFGSVALAVTSGRRWGWVAVVVAVPVFLVPEPGRIVMNLGAWNRPEIAGAASVMAAARGAIVFQRDSFSGRIAVWRETATGLLSFLVNGKADGSTGRSDMVTQAGSVHIAALSHPAPARCLVIGLGTGVSAGSLTLHPAVRSVDVVEIEPAQADVARIFAEANGGVLAHPKIRLVLDDARRHVAASSSSWDLIASEPSNLFVSGMVNLYTVEFYRSVKARLAPGGVFLQWVHYYQMDGPAIRGALATFLSVFPAASWWANEFGDGFLVAREGDPALDLDGWTRRIAAAPVAADLRRIGFDRPLDLVGLCVWGSEDLARIAAGGRVCTDDDPWLERASARVRWRPDSGLAEYAGMVMSGDLHPLPLVRESAGSRERLGRIFLERRSVARAAAEFRRALALAPGSAGARAGLRDTAAVTADLRSRFR